MHWTRANTESSIERAIARASTVLPVPGTSSKSTWPWQASAAMTSLISSCLPAQDELDVRREARRDRGGPLELGVRGRDLSFRPHRGSIAGP